MLVLLLRLVVLQRRGRDEERRAAGGDGEQSRRWRGRPGPRPHLSLSSVLCSGPGWQAAGDPSLDLPS